MLLVLVGGATCSRTSPLRTGGHLNAAPDREAIEKRDGSNQENGKDAGN